MSDSCEWPSKYRRTVDEGLKLIWFKRQPKIFTKQTKTENHHNSEAETIRLVGLLDK